MPSFAYTPGALRLTGAEINPEPIRFGYTAATLVLAGASMTFGANLATTDGDRLLRLQRQTSYFNAKGEPTSQMQLHWQRTMERIEQRFTDIEGVLALIQAAQALAAQAQQQALATDSKVNLANSYTNPVSGLLTATSAGAVTITAHSRVYGNGTTVSVNGGSLSGFSPGQFVRVYYTDPARAGGAVTYLGTTSEVVQEGDTHVVGAVLVPSVGEPDQSGVSSIPPGYVADYRDYLVE